MQADDIKIIKCPEQVSGSQFGEMVNIVFNYFPDRALAEDITRNHLQKSTAKRMALAQGRIVGFSAASIHTMSTPFYRRPVNLVFQRMLFVEPGLLSRGLGKRIQVATMKDLFGWFWPFFRLVVFCRTQNPAVAQLMNLFNLTYPQYKRPIPPEIRQFAKSLLPIIGAESVDSQFRLPGTLKALEGRDCTDIWNRYLRRGDDDCDPLMLENAFEDKGGRIINRGAFVLMIAYARPFNFIRYLFHR